MKFNPDQFSLKEKQILAGFFLSKFDAEGLRVLGFDTFKEAFNTLGYAFGGRPASIKNYRDEFDPVYSNKRQGWHRRPRREYCMAMANEYGGLGIKDFADLVISFFHKAISDYASGQGEGVSFKAEESFAKRLATGLAAERYFQAVQPEIEIFKDYEVEDTTLFGCGYDFRLWPKSHQRKNYLAVEVKGLAGRSGSLRLTEKEYYQASMLRDRYALFVVRNFQETPFHNTSWDPIFGEFTFVRQERTVVQVAWTANV